VAAETTRAAGETCQGRRRPELMPALMANLASPNALPQLRALAATLAVVKELVRKRIPAGARQLALVRSLLAASGQWWRRRPGLSNVCCGRVTRALRADGAGAL